MGENGSHLGEILKGDWILGAGGHERQDPRDDSERRRMIGKLFAVFGESDRKRAELYVELTRQIPRRVLAYALRSVVEAHVWSKVPTVAEIVQAAKVVAGMHRDQYRAGRYLPAPRGWPPEGKRYALEAGVLEPLQACPEVRPIAVGAGAQLALPEHASQ